MVAQLARAVNRAVDGVGLDTMSRSWFTKVMFTDFVRGPPQALSRSSWERFGLFTCRLREDFVLVRNGVSDTQNCSPRHSAFKAETGRRMYAL